MAATPTRARRVDMDATMCQRSVLVSYASQSPWMANRLPPPADTHTHTQCGEKKSWSQCRIKFQSLLWFGNDFYILIYFMNKYVLTCSFFFFTVTCIYIKATKHTTTFYLNMSTVTVFQGCIIFKNIYRSKQRYE